MAPPGPYASPQYNATLTEQQGWAGNSFSQNYFGDQGLPGAVHYILDQEQPSHTTSLNPISVDANTIGDSTGWFFALALSGMCFGGNGTTTTDALDNIYTNGVGSYDSLVFTSGWRQDGDSGSPPVTQEDVGLGTNGQYTAYLGWKRLIVADLSSNGYSGAVIFRQTQEGFNWNDDTSYADATRLISVTINAMKTLEQESLSLDVYNVPDWYVWYRLAVGNNDGVAGLSGPQTPVPTAQTFTHPASAQPANLNVGWLSRTQNQVSGVMTNNGHQNFIGSLVNCATWCYSIYGVDPATTLNYFSAPFVMPLADSIYTRRFISTDGLRIYGGQGASSNGAGLQGLDPYNNDGNNPGADPTYGAGPYDTDLDFDWNLTFRTEIADRIRGAVDDYYAGTTGFEV